MSIRLTPTDPYWSLEVEALETQVAQFAKNNNLTTQIAWNTFINTLTALQTINVCQALLRSIKCSNP